MNQKLRMSLNMEDRCCDSRNSVCKCKPSKRGYNLSDLFMVYTEYNGNPPTKEASADFDLQYCLNYEKATKTAHLLNMAWCLSVDAMPFIVAIVDKDGNIDNLWEDLEI